MFPSRLLLAVCLFASAALADPSFTGQAGLQLYSLREQFKTDVPGTLDLAKSYGVSEVETYGTQTLGADYRKLLEDRGLKAISGHFSYEPLTKDLAGCVAAAKALGLQYAVCPWIAHDPGHFTAETVQRAAADFNRWGEAFKKEGIQFAYHCHGYEFQPAGEGTLFDLLVQQTKPEFVAFQMDVFWVTLPGQDPVKLLQKYPTRWKLMHLKDMRKGAPVGAFTGHAPLTDDVPLGTGQMNWPAILKAAGEIGIAHYFIEDESPTSTTAIPQSLAYLKTLQGR